MSAKNGDKSRHQINRKRAVIRRAKIRDLVKSVKAAPAPSVKIDELYFAANCRESRCWWCRSTRPPR